DWSSDVCSSDLNLNYEGGFALHGARFIGAGTASTPSRLTYLRNGKPFIRTTASEINLTDEKVTAMNAATSIYLNTGDSITHPGLTFNYNLTEKIVELSRPSSGIGQAPFVDSYHKLDYYVSRLVWEVDANVIHFTYEKGTSQEQRLA